MPRMPVQIRAAALPAMDFFRNDKVEALPLIGRAAALFGWKHGKDERQEK